MHKHFYTTTFFFIPIAVSIHVFDGVTLFSPNDTPPTSNGSWATPIIWKAFCRNNRFHFPIVKLHKHKGNLNVHITSSYPPPPCGNENWLQIEQHIAWDVVRFTLKWRKKCWQELILDPHNYCLIPFSLSMSIWDNQHQLHLFSDEFWSGHLKT